jgi:hypothetical protein
MSHPVMHELSHHEYLRQRLETDFPEADEETLTDTLEGLTNLSDMLAVVIRSALEDQNLTKALKVRISDMHSRLTRIDQRAEKKRALIKLVMERAGLKKLTEPDFTVSLRPSRPPLLVDDETVVPEAFWKPQPPKLNRQALIAAISAGEEVPGAVLGNTPMTIAIRTK